MKMSKLKVAEIFYSLQGEGRYAGVPSVFLRTFGCNFECRGFALPKGEKSTEPDDIASVVHLYNTYEDLPLAETGCDSYASWHPGFKHLSPMMEIKDVLSKMESLIPNNLWMQPDGHDIHLVITGGEPLLGWQRVYPELITACQEKGLVNLTFETNGTQELTEEFRLWMRDVGSVTSLVTFSVSPKLTCSGESWEEAIKPDVVASYEEIGSVYLKFVVSTEDDVAEVDRAVDQYRAAGFTGPVYLMPVGGTENTYNLNTKQVAELAMKRGYRYSPRLQVDIWRNAWGT
jgi:7-carboxy-7-deazaguanine synthase